MSVGAEWRRRLGGSSAPTRGIVYMVLSGALFTVNDAIMKWLREDYAVGQAVCIRGLFALIALLIAGRILGGWATFRVSDWHRQLQRAALVVISTLTFIGSLRYLPLSFAMSIAFTGPLFTVALAGFLLGEHAGWRRWSAVLIGFAGLLLMLGPGKPDSVLAPWAWTLPLAAAVSGSLRDIVTRRMSLTDHSNATLLVSLTAVTIVGAAMSSAEPWITPNPKHLALFALAAVLVASGQFFLIESLRVAEAGLLAPFKYANYLWALVLGWMLWAHLPNASALLGAVVVIGSGVYIFWRERSLAAKRD
ncbi:MAG: DMT family transporter [Pseudomonadota bacterium]